MNRRSFFQQAATIALPWMPRPVSARQGRLQATDRILLGPRQVSVTRLAMGSGTDGVGGGSNQTRKLGAEGFADLLQAGYDLGITFWDSADQYRTHNHIRLALQRGIPRENVAILTKTHASTEAEMRADLDRFRRELGTDYLDIVLLHSMMDSDWPARKQGAMNVLAEAREKGIVRTHGVSCHTIGALQTAASMPWVEVDLARINPAELFMDAAVPDVLAVLDQMKAAGKGVIGMKILGAGKLRHRAAECIEFVLGQPSVDCFTIGHENIAELKDMIQLIAAAGVRA